MMSDPGVFIADVASPGRPKKFTPERIDQIRNLLERGQSREEIADIIGCTVNTLAVTCSRLGISLRRPRFDTGIGPKLAPKPRPAVSAVLAMTAPTKPIEPPGTEIKPAEAEHDRSHPVLALRMSYRGHERITPLPLTDEDIVMLALEAEIRGMQIGELIAAVIGAIVRRELFDVGQS